MVEKCAKIFLYLYQAQTETDDKSRFDKVSEVLGLDFDGNLVQMKKSYAPTYIRIEDNIPTTTNHIESFHKQLNSIKTGSRQNLHLRLAYTLKYINDRTM